MTCILRPAKQGGFGGLLVTPVLVFENLYNFQVESAFWLLKSSDIQFSFPVNFAVFSAVSLFNCFAGQLVSCPVKLSHLTLGPQD